MRAIDPVMFESFSQCVRNMSINTFLSLAGMPENINEEDIDSGGLSMGFINAIFRDLNMNDSFSLPVIYDVLNRKIVDRKYTVYLAHALWVNGFSLLGISRLIATSI